METVLILLGIGVSVGLLSLLESEVDQATEDAIDNIDPDPRTDFSDKDDIGIADTSRDLFLADLASLVREGEVSRSEAADILDKVEFVPSPIRIDTLGGDDAAIGGTADDTIEAGPGNDLADGGPGDDKIDLSAGDDVSGIDDRTAPRPDDIQPFSRNELLFADAYLEGGDDFIRGGKGNDEIADGFGSNTILGQENDDFLIAVDQDALSPGTVSGGSGNDVLYVDQGDQVETGGGQDRVIVDVFAGVAEGYQLVVIDDFNAERDIIEIEGPDEVLRDGTTDPVELQTLPGGEDMVILIDGIPAVQLNGANSLTRADIRLR
jgi:Ca2+-binding RTX toxin-like protein